MKLTFLGTGTSFGVPQLGCHCDVCHSRDPRDRRTRVGAAVETDGGSIILIDTPPELRLQLVQAEIDRVDAVLFTHDHADHTHGIDDLRAVTARRHVHLPMYGSADTLHSIEQKFKYIFDDTIKAGPGTSKPQGRAHVIAPGSTVRVTDMDVTAVPLPHGAITVFAYRIGPLAYVTDAKSVPEVPALHHGIVWDTGAAECRLRQTPKASAIRGKLSVERCSQERQRKNRGEQAMSHAIPQSAKMEQRVLRGGTYRVAEADGPNTCPSAIHARLAISVPFPKHAKHLLHNNLENLYKQLFAAFLRRLWRSRHV